MVQQAQSGESRNAGPDVYRYGGADWARIGGPGQGGPRGPGGGGDGGAGSGRSAGAPGALPASSRVVIACTGGERDDPDSPCSTDDD